MLVLSRQRDETIMIGDDIEITVVDIRGDKIRLGINAPKDLSVHRKEVYDAIRRESRAGNPLTPERKAQLVRGNGCRPVRGGRGVLRGFTVGELLLMIALLALLGLAVLSMITGAAGGCAVMQFGGAQLRQEAADRAAARAADRTVYRCPSCGGGGEPAIDPATCQAFCGSCGYVGGAVADFVVRVKRATAKTSAKAEGRKR